MTESKGLDLTLSNGVPEKYMNRFLERRRTHGTRRTTFRDFQIILSPRPAEQPRTPEQILQRPENVFDRNFSTSKSVNSKRKSVHDYDDDDDDDGYEQLLTTPTSKVRNNDRSRSSQMSFGSTMELDYSINVGKIEVLVSKAKFSDTEEQSDIIMMDEVDILAKSPEKKLDTILNELDNPEKSAEEQLDVAMDEVNEVDEGDIQAKSLEEQLDIVTDEGNVVKLSEEQEQVTEEIEISQSRRRSSRRKSKIGRDIINEIPDKSPKEQSVIIMDEEDVPAKSSIDQKEEQVTKEREINQSKRKSSRRKNKVGSSVTKDKDRVQTKSHEQLDIAMDEDVPDKSLEEQVEQITEERDIETSQSKKKPTRRKNKVGRSVAKNKGKTPAKSPEQSVIVMDEDVPDKSSEEQVEQITEERETSQSRKKPTRRKNKVGRGLVKNKDKAPEKLDNVVGEEDIPEDIPAISPEDQNVSEESINQPSEEIEDPEEAPEDQVQDPEDQITEEREISQGKKKSSRHKIKCHKTGRGVIQDKDGNTVRKTSATKLNELDVIGDSINDIIAEFLNDNSFKKEIQHLKNEIELNLLEQSDLLDEQIMLRSSLRQSKSRMNCLRKELLDVQRERDKVCRELASERRTFANEEQDRKKLEQAHNFLTDLETLREAVDVEDNMQEDEEGILDGFKGLLVSVTSRKGSLGVLSRFNMLLEVCEKIVRQATDT